MLTGEQASTLLEDYKEGANTSTNIDTNISTNDIPLLVETLKRHIEVLENQLTTKDLQIAELTTALSNSTKIQDVQAATLQRLGDGSKKSLWERLFGKKEV